MSIKRYLCVGSYITSPSDGDRHFISSVHLPRLYKVHPEVCALSSDAHEDESVMKSRYGNLIWLYPKADGKYFLPNHGVCKCGFTMIWMVTLQNKKIPVDCRHDIAWKKVFDPLTMTSHFATCPLAKEFKKRKGHQIQKETSYGPTKD